MIYVACFQACLLALCMWDKVKATAVITLWRLWTVLGSNQFNFRCLIILQFKYFHNTHWCVGHVTSVLVITAHIRIPCVITGSEERPTLNMNMPFDLSNKGCAPSSLSDVDIHFSLFHVALFEWCHGVTGSNADFIAFQIEYGLCSLSLTAVS